MELTTPNRFFIVFYVANSRTGLVHGQFNVETAGAYVNRREVSDSTSENGFESFVLTNIIEVTGQDIKDFNALKGETEQ
jgi:hypothetical protein